MTDLRKAIEDVAKEYEEAAGYDEGTRRVFHGVARRLRDVLIDTLPEPAPTKFFINQRVLVGNEIGTVQLGPTMVDGPPGVEPKDGFVWVHLPSTGYASCFYKHNVKPLPNGQF